MEDCSFISVNDVLEKNLEEDACEELSFPYDPETLPETTDDEKPTPPETPKLKSRACASNADCCAEVEIINEFRKI